LTTGRDIKFPTLGEAIKAGDFLENGAHTIKEPAPFSEGLTPRIANEILHFKPLSAASN
jgi:hypothetical protein